MSLQLKPPKRIPLKPTKALAHLRAADPKLAAAIDAVGPFELIADPPNLHTLCAAVIGQQLSIIVAARIVERFTLLAGGPDDFTPEHILRLGDEQLRGVGFSYAKIKAVKSLAEFWIEEELTSEYLDSLPDAELIELLTRVKGIGPWTAKMFLIFSLKRPDVLPHEDLGLRAGLKKLHQLEELPSRAETEALTAAWAPWRTVGTWYLWKFLKL